ncbi:MAG: TerC family protein, partial [Solirubrobacterales bacterium]|nr:TerC family protein [Solirubrobacterales bacterium]
TAIKLVIDEIRDEPETDPNDMVIIKMLRKVIPVTATYESDHLYVHKRGKFALTPLFIALVAIGLMDVMFALDSIPAIFGLTREPFIVLTANIFALMGLRQLYFLIGGLLKRLVYLSLGLSVLLAFIGVKLIMHALHENTLPFINGGEGLHGIPEIPIWLSLVAIVVILG